MEPLDILQDIYQHAIKSGYSVNTKIATIITKGLKRNFDKYKILGCPCVNIAIMDEDAREEYKCPCTTHKEDIENNGACHCMLFGKPGYWA